MTRSEFEEMFDLTAYEKVRQKYHAIGAFPHLFDKVKQLVGLWTKVTLRFLNDNPASV